MIVGARRGQSNLDLASRQPQIAQFAPGVGAVVVVFVRLAPVRYDRGVGLLFLC